MRNFLIAAALLGTAASVTAKTPELHVGQVVRDASNVRVGSVDRVGADGVRIIFDSRFVTLPSNTITVTDGKVTTTLSKAEVARLK